MMKKLTLLTLTLTITSFLFAQTGNVGIGTTSPGAKLHVDETTASFNGSIAKFLAPNANDNAASGNNNGKTAVQIGKSGANGGSAYLHYYANTTTPANARLSLSSHGNDNILNVWHGGNVGIGTGNVIPTAKLHVKGTLRAVNASDANEYMIYNGDNL